MESDKTLKMFQINPMNRSDWEAVRRIYQEGIATGQATFETQPPSWENWDRDHLPTCRLVTREDGAAVGWAALSSVSDRCVYAGVAEASVYVDSKHRGRGLGQALLEALILASEKEGIWTLQAGIFPENEASRALILACGFREIGRRDRLGKVNGLWRDVVLVERRSEATGVN